MKQSLADEYSGISTALHVIDGQGIAMPWDLCGLDRGSVSRAAKRLSSSLAPRVCDVCRDTQEPIPPYPEKGKDGTESDLHWVLNTRHHTSYSGGMIRTCEEARFYKQMLSRRYPAST